MMEENNKLEETKKVLVDKLVEDIKSLKAHLKDTKLTSGKEVIRLIVFLVKFVENLSRKEEIAKADKKAIAVELINRFVDIPAVPEFLEGKAIELVIDSVVEALDQNLGKNWMSRVHLG